MPLGESEKGGGGCLCARVQTRVFQYSNTVVVEGLTREVAFKQKPEGSKEASMTGASRVEWCRGHVEQQGKVSEVRRPGLFGESERGQNREE